MKILSQCKTKLIDTKFVRVSGKDIIAFHNEGYNSIIIGKYENEQRTFEVFQELVNIIYSEKMFEMPKK